MRVGILFPFFLVLNYANSSSNTLQFVHAIFRHGERTNIIEPLYTTNPYINETYLPYGNGQLTKKGMQMAYNLGKYLRRRYGNFLEYRKGIVQAVCSEKDRAQVTLQLVLAGLFQPNRTKYSWNHELNWQPIPFKSLSEDSHILSFTIEDCRNHEYYFSQFLNTEVGRNIMEKHAELFTRLSDNVGSNISSLAVARSIYYSLLIEEELGLKLPEWTGQVFPHNLESATLDFFYASAGTSKLRQLTGGYLLKKIIENTVMELKKKLNNEVTRIFLYSGHEYNLIYLMIAMKVFSYNLPPYTSCLMIEVHNLNGTDGLKVYYEQHLRSVPQLLKIPGCDDFCPLTDVISILSKNIPEGDVCEEDILE